MISTRTTAATLATAALVLTGGAATAASKSHRDVTGDAPVATADITRVVVKNGDHALMVQTKLAKATATRTHLVITLTPTAAGAPTYVARTVEVGHRVGATLETDQTTTTTDATSGETTGSTVTTPVDCAGIKATVSRGRRGQVLVRVPQACFGADAGTLVAQVATQTGPQVVAGTDDTTDESAALRVKRG